MYNEPYFGYASSLLKASNGGYIIAGWGNQSLKSSSENGIVIKTDLNGNKEWIKEYGDEDIFERIKFALKSKIGGYYLGGEKGGDIWLINIDENGNILWERTFGENFIETGEDACFIANDTTLFIIGNSWESGNGDIIVIKINYQGEVIWRKTFGDWRSEKGYACVFDNIGSNLIIAGTKHTSIENGLDGFLVKIDSNGKLLWQTTQPQEGGDILWDVETTFDGKILAVGTSSSFGLGTSIIIWKMDENGDKLNVNIFDELKYASAKHITKNSDNTFSVVGRNGNFSGQKSTNMLILNLDKFGNIESHASESKSFGLEGKSLINIEDGTSIFSGITHNQNIFMMKNN